MQAVLFKGPRHVVTTTVPLPQLEDDRDVLVKVTLAGLCGSDLHGIL
jgi:threonine dehydrogenase-like Zn-dependent dehydrogenase